MKKRRKTLLLILFTAASLFFSQVATAQSGRRQTRVASPTPTPAPVELETETKTGTPKVEPAPVATVIVGGDKFGSSLILLSSYVGEALASCVDRLREAKELEVVAGGHMTRADAVGRAKKEEAAYVLWLEVGLEDGQQENVVINYRLFIPQTAKSLTSGRIHPSARSINRGGVGVGIPGVNGRLPIQYLMKEGGRQVADRVRAKLSTSLPD